MNHVIIVTKEINLKILCAKDGKHRRFEQETTHSLDGKMVVNNRI